MKPAYPFQEGLNLFIANRTRAEGHTDANTGKVIHWKWVQDKNGQRHITQDGASILIYTEARRSPSRMYELHFYSALFMDKLGLVREAPVEAIERALVNALRHVTLLGEPLA